MLPYVICTTSTTDNICQYYQQNLKSVRQITVFKRYIKYLCLALMLVFIEVLGILYSMLFCNKRH